MDALKTHWKKLLVAGALVAGGVGFYAYWTMFRVDPDFAAAQEAIDEQQDDLDKAFGLDGGEDDFADLEAELEEGDEKKE